jgi:diguanylate cyclase (GGDEF)-like protein/PAS domain S-box-containing protein
VYFGPGLWPGVFLGSLVANFAVDLPLAPALALAVGNAIDPLVGVWGIRRYAGNHLDFGRTRHVLAYFAFAVLIGPSISAAFGIFGLQLNGIFSSLADDLTGWIGWAIEDALSVLIIGSALLVFTQRHHFDWSRRKWLEAAGLLAILAVNGWVVLTGTRGDPLSEPYLVLPLMLLVALRLGTPGAVIGNLLLTIVTAVAIMNRQGPFLLDTLTASMLWMQAFWTIAALTTMLLAAALNEARSERYRQMFEGNRTIQLVLDAATQRIVDANPAACAFYGQPKNALRRLSLGDLGAAADQDTESGDSFVASQRGHDGEVRDVEVHRNLIQIDGRSLAYAIVHDVSSRRRAEQALRDSEERLQLVARATKDTVWDWDMRANRMWNNQGLASMFGYADTEAITDLSWWLAQVHPDDRDTLWSTIQDTIQCGKETWTLEYRFRRADASYAHVLTRGYVQYEAERPVRMVGVLLDLSERKRMEQELSHRATHDPLTGLPNRALIDTTLRAAIQRSRCDESPMTLLIADLDHFKEVNDTISHHAGDAVLQVVAERWRAVLRHDDVLGRLAGDEFAVVLPSADAPTAAIIAERLVRALDRPLSLEGHSVRVGASIGAATFPDDAADFDELLRHADHAMYMAKRGGGGSAPTQKDALESQAA